MLLDSQVVQRLRDHMGINLHLVDASDRFLSALEGVVDPEQKRKIIGANFIEVFQVTLIPTSPTHLIPGLIWCNRWDGGTRKRLSA